VVFSFFKKDPKDAKDRKASASSRGTTAGNQGGRGNRPLGRPLPDPSNRVSPARLPSQRFATTETALPERDLHRSLAMETAAKIDKIESDMARDFLRPGGETTGQPAASANAVASPSADRIAIASSAPDVGAAQSGDESADPNDEFFGSVNAIEINTSGSGSIIDETAILFANGQDVAAEQVLRAGLEGDDLGHATHNAWLLLFELLNQRGDRAGFEQLTMQYALRFENSSPSWVDYTGLPARASAVVTAAAPAAGAPTVRLPAQVDANVVKVLEQLKTLAASHAALTVDAGGVRSIDFVGAELLLRVLNAFKRAAHELVIAGAEQLLVPLRALIEPGRRDASDAGWMLLLEVLRLLKRQTDFEETGIQYCITFEVSPPQWEPAPPNMRTGGVTGAAAEPVAATSVNPLAWHGIVEAEGEPWFGRLAAEARTNKELVVDCAQLRRIGFSTASGLLTLVMKLQRASATVEFREVNPLVGALFQLLGITAVAAVQVRRP